LLADRLAEDDTDVTNEDELRVAFIDCLKEVNQFGYTFKAWLERLIVISVDGDDVQHWPDVQLKRLVVCELKSFFLNQKYSAAQAKALVEDDLTKLKNYEGLFSVGFMLCFSNKFTVAQMQPASIPKYSYPVRVLILSSAGG
jgi:hypothetical protein